MKVSGSTISLMQGVGQQVPQDRRPGQHTEQINMLPDPVQGLSRRHGSRWLTERDTTLSPSDFDAMVLDTQTWRTFGYSNQGNDYVVLYRTGTRPAGSSLPVLQVYNRSTNSFLPLTTTASTQLGLLEAGGVSALTAIGKLVFIAGNTTTTSATSADIWGDASNTNDAVVWVRGGAYGRTYRVTATRTDNTSFTFSYTTPTSSYPSPLDTRKVPVYAGDPGGLTPKASDREAVYVYAQPAGINQADLAWGQWATENVVCYKGDTLMSNVWPATPSGILEYSYVTGAAKVYFSSSNLGATDIYVTYEHWKTVPNPSYTRLVQDLTNDYNSKVTAWIGEAAYAITPAAIATQLQAAAAGVGLTGTVQGSTLIFTNVKALVVNDGGDGSLIRGVSNEVVSVDQVSDIHKVGKVVKVRAKNAAEAFYLRAVPKTTGLTGYTEVTWVEGAGVVHTITNALLYLTVSGSTAYLSATAAGLDAMIPAGAPHPTYALSTVGDNDTSPPPFFVGKKITYLGVFQDRLLVGAGAVIRASKIGDYLNFFRSSVLTVPADDPLEMLSQGSEDDVLRFSVLYDRDLVIFADKRQYAISGRSALTPTEPSMQVMSSHAAAAALPPLAVGGVIFYGQLGEKASAVFQIQPGQVAESPESYIVSSQVDTYLTGSIIELANNAKPTHLFARTTGARNSIFCYTYLDQASQGRVQDSWHRLDFHSALGPVVGMSPTPAGLLVYTLRRAVNNLGVTKVWFVVDLMPLTTGLASYPHLDSIRPLATVVAGSTSVHPASTGDWRVAFNNTSAWFMVGTDLADYQSLVAEFPSATGPMVGIDQPAAFTPTNPYVRDKNDKAITSGSLTVTAVRASLTKSSGFVAELTSFGRETQENVEYNARVVGSIDNVVGRETITDIIQTVPVALETRDYKLTLRARKWLPFTLSTLEWVGQWFNRTQRL